MFAVQITVEFNTEEEADEALLAASHAHDTGQELVVSAGTAYAAGGTPTEWRVQ